MAKNQHSEGRFVDITLGADILSGVGFQTGQLFGVAMTDGKNGESIAFDTQGAYTLPKVSTDEFTVGALVYWDASPGTCTSTGSGNLLIGTAIVAAANPSDTVVVRLNGYARANEA